jgi:hypothetical protein
MTAAERAQYKLERRQGKLCPLIRRLHLERVFTVKEEAHG